VINKDDDQYPEENKELKESETIHGLGFKSSGRYTMQEQISMISTKQSNDNGLTQFREGQKARQNNSPMDPKTTFRNIQQQVKLELERTSAVDNTHSNNVNHEHGHEKGKKKKGKHRRSSSRSSSDSSVERKNHKSHKHRSRRSRSLHRKRKESHFESPHHHGRQRHRHRSRERH